MARRLAVAKRISLEGVVEGFTEDCYALMMPISYPDMAAANDSTGREKAEDNLTWQNEFLTSHFVSGKVMIYGDDGSLELADMIAEDITASLELSAHLAAALIGGNVADPKDSSEDQLPGSEPSSDEMPTDPQSSTTKQ